jgi:histone H3/H4
MSGKTELPLSRVKRIMKADPDVKNVSADAAYLVTRAAELFLQRITERSAEVTRSGGKKTVMYQDVAIAVKRFPEMDFLADIVPTKKVVGAKK